MNELVGNREQFLIRRVLLDLGSYGIYVCLLGKLYKRSITMPGHSLGIILSILFLLLTLYGCDSDDTDVSGTDDAGTDALQQADATAAEDSKVDDRRGEAINLKVAAVQIESKNDDIRGNLEHATELVDQAAEKGAELIY